MKDKINQIVHFPGQISPASIKSLIDSLENKYNMGQFEKEKDILISLKGIENNNNPKLFISLIHTLKKIMKKFEVHFSFIDYSVDLYTFLKNTLVDTGIELFKNREVANLFLYPEEFSKNVQLLVYDEDIENIQALSSVLIGYKFKIVVVSSMKEFLFEMKRGIYDISITRTTLNTKKIIDKKAEKSFKLSKQVIINLPIFMNKAVDTLVSFTGFKAKKNSHCIQEFDTSLTKDNICAVMTFYGDLKGSFTLIFPKDIAIIALESLLQDAIKSDDLKTLEDGVGEFCNIITGSTKTAFDEKGIKILFELPKTFHSLEETVLYLGNNKGVWMNMELSDKRFYMFITQ